MPRKRLFIRTVAEFRRHWRRLRSGDAVMGPLAFRSGEEIKLVDLADRGVALFPPALAQLLSRSKVAQAEVLAGFMPPGTFVAYSHADLAAQLSEPLARRAGAVITKRDRAHLGLGVSLWPSLEVLVSLGALHPLPYPLVVQPFIDAVRDLRAVVLGDYVEAYERINPHSFRKNLFQGGAAQAAALNEAQLCFCRQVMARGRFPYAILDLLISPEDQVYLAEINLKGGLTGASLNQAEFRRRVQALEEDFRCRWENSLKTRP